MYFFVLFYVFYFCVVLYIVCFVSFSVLFVCIRVCVLNYCHRVATQLQLNISHHKHLSSTRHEQKRGPIRSTGRIHCDRHIYLRDGCLPETDSELASNLSRNFICSTLVSLCRTLSMIFPDLTFDSHRLGI
jgi:hypothetical protein